MSAHVEQLPSQELLNRCAERWGLRNCTFVRKMENIVYVCDSDAGKVYLRLTTPLRRARAEIEAEVNWIEHLAKCGLKVPRLVPDREGNKIVSFVEGTQHFEAVAFHAIVGEHPTKEAASDPSFLKTLGVLIAKMHLASQCYEGMHQGMKREEWFEERGLRHAITAAPKSNNSPLRNLLENMIAWMQQLPRTQETYGLIHADLGVLNLIQEEDNSISIIDFDDSCYHWFVFDLGVVIASIIADFEQNISKDLEVSCLSYLIEGYKTVRALPQEEIEWVPRFVNFIFLRLYFWIEYHEALGTFHEDAFSKVSRIKQQILNRFA